VGGYNGAAAITATSGRDLRACDGNRASDRSKGRLPLPCERLHGHSLIGGRKLLGWSESTLRSPLPCPRDQRIAKRSGFAGTSPQTINANVSGSGCPASIGLTNSILPVPYYESNVAPFGLIQIDGEQFTYFGKTNATGSLSSNVLTITGCAQNGTARSAHTSGATVVPL